MKTIDDIIEYSKAFRREKISKKDALSLKNKRNKKPVKAAQKNLHRRNAINNEPHKIATAWERMRIVIS